MERERQPDISDIKRLKSAVVMLTGGKFAEVTKTKNDEYNFSYRNIEKDLKGGLK